MPTSDLTILERMTIQMEYVVPLIRDLERILGKETVHAALAKRVELMTEDAKPHANPAPDLASMAAGLETYAQGDALDYTVHAADAERFDFDVTGCRYAQMMEQLGARDLGPQLICNLDFPMAERAGLELRRTQTCMQGASHCDFRYRKKTGADAS